MKYFLKINIYLVQIVPIDRTSSEQTFDSLDLARYSDDGNAQNEDKCTVLEFELRKAKETIKALRASFTEKAGEFIGYLFVYVFVCAHQKDTWIQCIYGELFVCLHVHISEVLSLSYRFHGYIYMYGELRQVVFMDVPTFIKYFNDFTAIFRGFSISLSLSFTILLNTSECIAREANLKPVWSFKNCTEKYT